MRYAYENATGDTLNLMSPMETPPPWVVFSQGVRYQRVVQVQRSRKERQKTARDGQGNRIGNNSLPLNWPFAKKHDSRGRPVFDTHQEKVEAEARAAEAGEFAGPRELSQPGDLPQVMRADD